MLWLDSVSCHHGDHGEPGSWISANKLVCTLISQSSEPITCEPASMESQQHLKKVPATSYKSETTKKTKLIAFLHPPCLYSCFISHVQFYVLCNVHTEAFRAYRFRTNRSIQVVQPNGRFRAPASSPQGSPCNLDAAIPMRSATKDSRNA